MCTLSHCVAPHRACGKLQSALSGTWPHAWLCSLWCRKLVPWMQAHAWCTNSNLRATTPALPLSSRYAVKRLATPRGAGRGAVYVYSSPAITPPTQVPHVASGLAWFTHLCKERGDDPIPTFHSMVRQHIARPLPGPFEESTRLLANMGREWYGPVSNGR